MKEYLVFFKIQLRDLVYDLCKYYFELEYWKMVKMRKINCIV